MLYSLEGAFVNPICGFGLGLPPTMTPTGNVGIWYLGVVANGASVGTPVYGVGFGVGCPVYGVGDGVWVGTPVYGIGARVGAPVYGLFGGVWWGACDGQNGIWQQTSLGSVVLVQPDGRLGYEGHLKLENCISENI